MDTRKELAEQMYNDLVNVVSNRNWKTRELVEKTLKSDEAFRESMVERFNQYVTLRKMILDIEDAKSPVDEDRYEDGTMYTATGRLMKYLVYIRDIEFDFDVFMNYKINEELQNGAYEPVTVDPSEYTNILGKLYDGERYESVQKYLNEKYDLDG